MGNDGVVGGSNGTIARDAYGYSLNYFSSDYKPIGQSVSGFKQPFINNTFDLTNSDPSLVARQLYNGNIAAMVTAIPKFNQINPVVPIANIYGYKYDQLNRIISMDVFTGLSNNTNTFVPASNPNYKERITYDPNGNIRTYQRNGTTLTGGLQTMDDLTYQYEKDAAGNILSNKLRYVHDQVADANYIEDINNQTTLTLTQVQNERSAAISSDNYQYDAIGNLIKDTKEDINNIIWNVYGKIQSITKTTGTISYTYDASGNRISKLANGIETWYVRDASGNVMSVYTKDATINTGNLTQTEIHLYGSSRLGVLNTATNVQNVVVNTTGIYTFIRGNKFFELSNHLGNVLVTISDKKIGHDAGNGTIDYYTADVVTANDYYPFGMIMPGRKYSGGTKYRYGYNGKEQDPETYGEGNIYDYGFRIYNPRLGRFLSVDPLTKRFPKYTPFQFAGDKPIVFIDLDGKEEYDPSDDPYFLKNIWDNAVDGLGNLLLKLAIPQTEGAIIRKGLKIQGFTVPNEKYVSDSYLARVFDVHKENRTLVVTPERTAVEKLLEAGFSALDVLTILPTKGSPYILAAKVSPITAATISNIIKDLTIGARTKEIAETFVDITKDIKGTTKIGEFEAQGAAILEQSQGVSLRGLKQGETGDYAFESGILGGKSVVGKTIDQLGIPASAVGKFKIGDLTSQITKHFNKKGVDFILLDGRNLSAAEKTTVMDYIKTNHAKDANRLITIGF